MRNLLMILEYDGSAYHGWQRQKGLITVQEVLEECIGRITGEKIRISGSGRTDAGVHALNQAANFTTNSSIEVRNLLAGINSLLPPDVVIKQLKEVDPSFHARFSVKSKIYLYQIFNGPIRPVLQRRQVWHVRPSLDLVKMEKGLALITGCHDFSAFCGKREDNAHCVRTIMAATMEKTPWELLKITLEADGFLRYMVRSIVGTLVDIGRGRKDLEELAELLETGERKLAGITAPPQGLFLARVKY